MNINYADSNELAIAWIDLSYVQNSIFSRQTKPILQSLSGQINFHTLTALMGPSGAGKTTLLKCINMRNNTGLTANTKVFVNKYTPLKTCFIMQSSDEHLFMGLTVRESLLFASKIKNRVTTGRQYRDSYAQTGDSLLALESYDEILSQFSHYSNDSELIDEKGNFDHNRNVSKALSELLLIDCANNLVNICSGGEQKRLSVAQELVQQNKPNLLCIDEPTSGLDSNAAELVIQCLSELVVRHRMSIVTSIHQPNSLLLSMFDQLYVLSKGGHCVFTGRPNLLRQHLLKCDITCDEDVLPIELLLKIASKFPNRRRNPFEKFKRDQTLKEINSIDKLIDENMAQTSDEIQRQCQMFGKLVDRRVNKHNNYFNFYHLYYLTLRGFSCFIRYEWRKTLVLTLFSLVVGFFFAYLFGTEIGKADGCFEINPENFSKSMPQTMEEILEVLSQESDFALNFKCQYFVDMYMPFIFLSSAVLVFPSEVKIFLNEHKNKWYSTSSYFWSKYFTEIPISITVSYLYSLIAYNFTGQLNEMYRFAYFSLIKLSGIFIATSIGQLIGIIFSQSYQVACTVAIGFYLLLFLLSGFLVPMSRMDLFVKAISYISSIKMTFESTLISLYGFDRCNETQIQIILKQMDLNDDSFWTNAYILLGHVLIWRFLAFLVLLYKANDFNIMSLFRRKRKN